MSYIMNFVPKKLDLEKDPNVSIRILVIRRPDMPTGLSIELLKTIHNII